MSRETVLSSRQSDFQMATIDGATGQMKSVDQIRRPKKMDPSQLRQALEGTQMIPLGKDGELEPHVTLSARQPYVAGKGWINAWHVRTFFAESPSMGWAPQPGQQIAGFLEVWLGGLAPNALYVAEVEIGSWGTGPFEIQAVSDAGVEQQSFDPGAGFFTQLVTFGTTAGGVALIRVSNPGDWQFYGISVSSVMP